jgi:hypothetical protein
MASYKRVPMVRDLEYLAAFLRSVNNGGRSKAEQEIRRLRLQFESDKDKAVSKGKKLDEKKLRLESLVTECERLSYETGIIEKQGERYKINATDPDVSLLLEGNSSDQGFRTSLLKRLIITYSSFNALIFQMRAAPEGKIYASHDRVGENFRRSIERYGLDMTQWTFEASRDLGTQLDLINWRMLDPEEVSQDPVLGRGGYLLYLTSTICRLSELQVQASSSDLCGEFAAKRIQRYREDLKGLPVHNVKAFCESAADRGYVCIEAPGDAVLIKHEVVVERNFEEVLWQEYLKMTDRVPREPVYYCQLRDRVCEILQVPDHLFDRTIENMINNPALFSIRVSPGEGSLPMQRAASRKQIPPKYLADSYMVYLKIERPRSV